MVSWTRPEKLGRMEAVAELLIAEHVETEADLRAWLRGEQAPLQVSGYEQAREVIAGAELGVSACRTSGNPPSRASNNAPPRVSRSARRECPRRQGEVHPEAVDQRRVEGARSELTSRSD